MMGLQPPGGRSGLQARKDFWPCNKGTALAGPVRKRKDAGASAPAGSSFQYPSPQPSPNPSSTPFAENYAALCHNHLESRPASHLAIGPNRLSAGICGQLFAAQEFGGQPARQPQENKELMPRTRGGGGYPTTEAHPHAPLQRFHSCCIPKPQMLSGFFTKKKPPSATVKYGYMYCGTALMAPIIIHAAPPATPPSNSSAECESR